MKRFPSAGDPSVLVAAGPVVDCHQHLWSESFVEQLRRRGAAPRMDGWTLFLDGQPPVDIDPGLHQAAERRELDAANDIDLTLYSLSAPLGIEQLTPEQAQPLLDAFHSYADEIATDRTSPEQPEARAGIWASCSLVEPDLTGLRNLLAHPHVHGLQVPATAMLTPAALEALVPVLAVAESCDAPVLVHPGPATGHPGQAFPAWWPAMTDYLAQQSAAWFAWRIAGRSNLPTLRIAFVALAGLAPLHHERLVQRGGEFGAIDHSVFYETSSYGTRAVDAMVRVVGIDPLIHGSDLPYAAPTDPGLGAAFAHALFVANPAQLLTGGKR